jgi:shikimate kinase
VNSIGKEKIFLVGFMGSGKTHWGRLWSEAYIFSFVDLDHAIEKENGKTIPKIFEEEGEDHFRKIETATLRSFTSAHNVIIACGGGTPCFHNNMHWMNENGITVYLRGTPQQLAERLIKEQQQRPLLHNVKEHELEDFIKRKLSERESFYNQAQIILDTKNITTETFKEIINS